MNATIPGTPYSRRFEELWSAAHNLRGRDRITYGQAVNRFGVKLVQAAIADGAVYPEQETAHTVRRIRDLAQVTPEMMLRANCQAVG
jgi:hypothetical protein